MPKITHSESGCTRWLPIISVVTPTIRKEGLEIVANSLKKQTFKSFEWIIGSPFDPGDLGVHWTKWVKDDFTGGFWSLNRIYNKMFKEAKGDIIVSLQDWIHIPPRGLEAFLEAFKEVGEASVIGAVGDQYEKIGEFGRPEVKIWNDPRKTDKYGSLYECNPSDIEWNYCALPKKAIFDVGGFCEELDFTGFGMDGYQVNERLDLMGYKTYLAQDIESYTLRHGRESYKGEDNWNKNNNLSNGQYEKVRAEFIKRGQWPKMNYLT